LSLLTADWMEVNDLDAVKMRAHRLLEVHPLRAADALQLAAGLVGVFDQPEGFEFVTFDGALGAAAKKEGFSVLGPQ
jgi:predicted nucleic acid-binding protein